MIPDADTPRPNDADVADREVAGIHPSSPKEHS